MPNVAVSVRVTRTKRCPEGFYAIINRVRIRFKRRADALQSIVDLLRMQRLQVVSVREYARRIRIPKEFIQTREGKS